ncbi:MAG TPA: fatty acid--CoA ligase family protein, partial [Rhizomicrobium sp.]|nr:fatty acid--CoA ligase family protein [Rhizomicrobium sp.]
RAKLTYGQIRFVSLGIAARLHKFGVRSGQRVALYAANPALQCALVVALNRLAVAVCILPHETPRRKAGLEVLRYDWVLSDNDEEVPGSKISLSLEWLTTSEPDPALEFGGFANPDDTCLILMSSGTTSAAKPIGYTVRQMENRILWRGFGEQATHSGEKTALLSGLASMMGFHITFGTMWGGGTMYIGWDAEAMLRVIAAERIERLFGSPPLLARMMDALEAHPMDVSCLRLVYAGGDSIPVPLARRITAKMCKNLLGGFGMNETGQIAAVSVERAGFKNNLVGFLYPWAEAQAVDDDDRVLPPGTEGRLRFRSASTSDGYVENPEATAAYFKDGWFYPGDIGWVTRDRMLVFSGRRSELIKTESAKIHPGKIDQFLAGYPGITECASFGVPTEDGADEIWLGYAGDPDLAMLGAYCREKLGDFAPTHFLKLDKIPRNEMGKMLRWRLTEMIKEGRR